jgi:hypothetical protein
MGQGKISLNLGKLRLGKPKKITHDKSPLP